MHMWAGPPGPAAESRGCSARRSYASTSDRIVDWDELFVTPDSDRSRFTASEPQWIPPVTFDTRAAWDGSLAHAPSVPTRVEAAAWKGRPVYFRVFGPGAALFGSRVRSAGIWLWYFAPWDHCRRCDAGRLAEPCCRARRPAKCLAIERRAVRVFADRLVLTAHHVSVYGTCRRFRGRWVMHSRLARSADCCTWRLSVHPASLAAEPNLVDPRRLWPVSRPPCRQSRAHRDRVRCRPRALAVAEDDGLASQRLRHGARLAHAPRPRVGGHGRSVESHVFFGDEGAGGACPVPPDACRLPTRLGSLRRRRRDGQCNGHRWARHHADPNRVRVPAARPCPCGF